MIGCTFRKGNDVQMAKKCGQDRQRLEKLAQINRLTWYKIFCFLDLFLFRKLISLVCSSPFL